VGEKDEQGRTVTGGVLRATPMPMRRLFAVVTMSALLSVGGACLAAPAWAGFKVCNKTNLKTRVAIGRFDGTHWTSRGWWTIAPKSCADLLTGPLDARDYYLYATDGAAGTWEGGTHFCVAPGTRFTIPGRQDCAGRGYDRRGFFEVDTGNDPDWTQTLSN
jgi:uncharacterized membrane protein